MVEVTLLNYLKDVFEDDNIPVYPERPEKRPTTEYIVMEKTGGTKTNLIPANTFAFQSYGPTLYKASVLNERVKTAVENAVELEEISSVTPSSNTIWPACITEAIRCPPTRPYGTVKHSFRPRSYRSSSYSW